MIAIVRIGLGVCLSVHIYIFFWSGRPRVQLQVLAGNTKITEHSCMIYRTYTDLINAQPRLLESDIFNVSRISISCNGWLLDLHSTPEL